jgi:hypothetical protein
MDQPCFTAVKKENDMNVDECATDFQGCLTGSAAGILDAATVIAKADEGLTAEEKKTLREKLRMKEAKFSKYLTIARCEHLRDFVAMLPPSFSTIHLLAQLDRSDLEELAESGFLHQNMTRRKLEQWMKDRRRAPAAEPTLTVCVHPNAPNDVRSRVHELEAEMRALPGVKVVRLQDRLAA